MDIGASHFVLCCNGDTENDPGRVWNDRGQHPPTGISTWFRS